MINLRLIKTQPRATIANFIYIKKSSKDEEHKNYIIKSLVI